MVKMKWLKSLLCALLLAKVVRPSKTTGPPVIREHPKSLVLPGNDPATLNCDAVGAQTIRWFKDGKEIFGDREGRPHRKILLTGSLFFLRLISTKKYSDAGTYWCVASNSFGSTRSQKATLVVATLDDTFLKLPEPNLRALKGESIVLPCVPPKGTPEPEVFWYRDNELVLNSSRIQSLFSGDLVISSIMERDAGDYHCRAQNKGATRDSQPIRLTVMIPPYFEDRPRNITATTGLIVEIPCKVRGFPVPGVTWRRLDGKMPLGRIHVTLEHTLQIESVSAADSGVYVCEAQSDAGVASAKASLTIVAPPRFLEKPNDLQILLGSKAKFSCRVEGEPPPLILWKFPSSVNPLPMIAGQNDSEIVVSEDGQSVALEHTSVEHTGEYACWGVSDGGGIAAKASLFPVKARPPPVIGIRPHDQWAFPGDAVTFPCEAVSEAAPATISWKYRSAYHLPAHDINPDKDARMSVAVNGPLKIKNVQKSDSGIYSCHISAQTGNVEQEATLQVLKNDEKPPITADSLQLPAPPSKPRIYVLNETSVQLKWHPNSRAGDHSSYTVEYWRPGWHEWRIAEAAIKQEHRIFTDLNPNHTYVFLVRASNSLGESYPSPWSDVIQTKSLGSGLKADDIRQANRRLSRSTVSLVSVTVTEAEPDSVLLTWEFLSGREIGIEGLLVYWVSDEIKVATIMGVQTTSHLQRGLTPNTKYTFFLVPFWRTVEGTPSNSQTISTPEDVPSKAPSDVRVRVQEDTVLITWSPLNPKEAQGSLEGYRVTLSHNNSDLALPTHNSWLEIKELDSSHLYTVRVAAVTRAGVGPMSSAVRIDFSSLENHDFSDFNLNDSGPSVLYAPPQPAWLAYLLVPVVLLLVLVTVVYIRRLRRKASSVHLPQPPGSGIYSDASLYPAHHHHSVNMYGEQKLWRPTDSDKDSSLSSTRLLRPDHLINEYAEPRIHRLSETTEPYAMTALLAPSSPRRCRPSGWMTQHHSEDSGVQVNWASILPPPPSCPPPPSSHDPPDPESCHSSSSSCSSNVQKSPLSCCSTSKYDNIAGSDQYERPYDASSDHTYEAYNELAQPAGAASGSERDPFRTFNSLQARGYRKVWAEFHPVRPSESPKSHTH